MDNDKQKKPEFDADFSAQHPINQQAATAHNLRFDEQKQAYVDVDGCMTLDQFGQSY